MGQSLSAAIVFGSVISCAGGCDSPAPWEDSQNKEEWWYNDEDYWLAHVYGADEDATYEERRAAIPEALSFERTSWHDEMGCVIASRVEKREHDGGVIHFDPTSLIATKVDMEVFADFAQRSGWPNNPSWIVVYNYW